MQDTIWKPKEKGKGSPCLANRYPFFHSPVLSFKKITENFLVKASGGTDTYLFCLVTSDRTRVNGLKLCQGSFRVLDWVQGSSLRRLLSTGMSSQGSGHSMKSESTKFLDNTLRHTGIILCGARSWTRRFLWVPYNAETSVILWHCTCGLYTCHSAYTSNFFFLLFPSSYLPSLALSSLPNSYLVLQAQKSIKAHILVSGSFLEGNCC